MNILIVYKKSTYLRYLDSDNQDLKELLTTNHENIVLLKENHKTESKSIKEVIENIKTLNLSYKIVMRENLKQIENQDLVITVGGDGTFLDVSHFINDETPILGINSNPSKSVGFFCSITSAGLKEVIKNIHETKRTKLNRLKIIRNGEEIKELALNDVYLANSNPAATIVYRVDDNNQENKTSGVLVSTAAGSTGWIYQEMGEVMPLNSEQLQYLPLGLRNREPKLTNQIKVISLTKEGQIFIDGPHIKYPFEYNDNIEIKKGTPLIIIGEFEKRRANFK
jgi:NAD+ kinase